jgi:hypothetical protein
MGFTTGFLQSRKIKKDIPFAFLVEAPAVCRRAFPVYTGGIIRQAGRSATSMSVQEHFFPVPGKICPLHRSDPGK